MRRLFVVLALCLTAAVPAYAGPVAPHDPWAGPDGTATMHGDPESSDSTPYAGPGAHAAPGVATMLPAVCPTILAGSDGLLQALCTEYADQAPSLYLIDPATGAVLVRRHLSKGSLLGGVYAYIDAHNRLVTVDGGSGSVVLIAHHRTATGWYTHTEAQIRIPFTRICGSATCDAVATVAPDTRGNVWFATAGGRAGFTSLRTRTVAARALGQHETVANSISTAALGTAVTTDHATYLLRDANGHVAIVWRRAYDRGPARKPGQLSWGSGATPTFFGPATGSDYVAITDNAVPLEHLLVYNARTGTTVCTAPIFGQGNSGTENSPIGFNRSVYVASTYGYAYPSGASGTSQPLAARFVGGLQGFQVPRSGSTCVLQWTNPVASAAVPRLSRAEKVIYTVERGAGGLTWNLVRINAVTGHTESSTPLGAGPQADTLQMVGTILPNRTLIQGTITGFVTVRP